jgi:sucrose-6-phosphate hydrolase SacC (GH32 family)
VGTKEIAPRELKPGENALDGISGELLDIDLEIELQNATQVGFELRGEKIVYDVREKKLKVMGRALTLAPLDGKLVLRALLDRTSIELFGNHGDVTFSGVFFPAPSERHLTLTVEGSPARVAKIAVHELRSIWDEPIR